LWTELGGTDAAKAWRAAWRLADSPDAALPLLRERLKPTTAAPATVTDPLLVDLDNDSFAKRKQALQRLRDLGPRAEPALRKALEAKPSPEQRRQVEELLAALASPGRPLTAEELREVRAVLVLERLASPEARRLLEALAEGIKAARLTQEAQAALQRQR
jgi:hypothetical protein